MASQCSSTVFDGYHVGGLCELFNAKFREKQRKKKKSFPTDMKNLFPVSQSFQPSFVSVSTTINKDKVKSSPDIIHPEAKLQHIDGSVNNKEQWTSAELKKTHKRKAREDESNDEEVPSIPKKQKHLPKKHESQERLERTIFVGNLPTSVTKKKLKKLFIKYGEVESVRFRSATMANPNLSRKVAMKKKEFHADKPFVNGYVVFKEMKAAKQAITCNGEEIEGLHIRVDLAAGDKKHDHKRSVFVGNLPFDLNDEQLREAFTDCGQIESVRIVRDQKTRMGKGFGFIQFKDKDAVMFALKMNKKTLSGRTLRVFPSSENPTDNVKKLRKGKPSSYLFSGMEAKKTRHRSDKRGKQIKNLNSVQLNKQKQSGGIKKTKGYQNKNAALKRIQNKNKGSKKKSKR